MCVSVSLYLCKDSIAVTLLLLSHTFLSSTDVSDDDDDDDQGDSSSQTPGEGSNRKFVIVHGRTGLNVSSGFAH